MSRHATLFYLEWVGIYMSVNIMSREWMNATTMVTNGRKELPGHAWGGKEVGGGKGGRGIRGGVRRARRGGGGAWLALWQQVCGRWAGREMQQKARAMSERLCCVYIPPVG